MVSLLIIPLLIVIAILVYCFIFSRYGYLKLKSNVCLIGKTALVTGGSSGIGYQIVLKLAARGCRVIIADKIVNDEIRESIVSETKNHNIVLKYMDCASFKSVREFAKDLSRTEEKLDILINNVGIGKSLGVKTEDGLNMTMQINHYSPFLLTHLLVDLLKKSKDGRIIFTSSILSYVHLMFPFSVTPNELKDLPSSLRFFDYPNSKFCNVVSAKLFAEKLKKYNIKSNAYHPLAAKTAIWGEAEKNVNYGNLFEIFLLYFAFHPIRILLGIHPSDVCQTAVELAISKDFENMTGSFYGTYFPDLNPRRTSDEKFCQSIWKASEAAVKLKPDERLE